MPAMAWALAFHTADNVPAPSAQEIDAALTTLFGSEVSAIVLGGPQSVDDIPVEVQP